MQIGRTVTTRRRVHRSASDRAHRVIRSKVTGACLLVSAVALAVYAVPCFAASIWDEGLVSQRSETVFAEPINDTAYPTDVAATAQAADATEADVAAGASAVRAASKVNASVTETTGPGIALDDTAVSAAKKRVQAVTAAQVERDTVIGSIAAAKPAAPDRTLELLTGIFALLLALLFGILGTRSIVVARRMRARVAAASYGHALKA